jgi:hypothetical protein
MGLKADIAELEKEVKAGEISFNCQLTITQKLKIVKENKPCRLEEQVEAELRTHGCKLTGLKLPAKIQLLKQEMAEKEEHAGDEYDILTSGNTSCWYCQTALTNQSLKIVETYLC